MSGRSCLSADFGRTRGGARPLGQNHVCELRALYDLGRTFRPRTAAPFRAGAQLFLQAFGSRLADARPARIIAFRSEKEYQPYRPSEFAAAFYQAGIAHDFIVMSSAGGDLFPVAVHEYAHLMIHQSKMELPAWLNEGLAELYSSLEPRGNKMLVGQILARPPEHTRWRALDSARHAAVDRPQFALLQ